MDFTDHSKANTTIVTTSGQHMCHLFLCTYQQHPAHSVFTARSQISPSLLCCEYETVERTEEKNKSLTGASKTRCQKQAKAFYLHTSSSAQGCQFGRGRPGLNYTLHTAADERKGEVQHTCWKLLIEGKCVPACCGDLCQVIPTRDGRHSWDHPEKREEQGEAWTDRKIDGILSAATSPACTAIQIMAGCFLNPVKKRLHVLPRDCISAMFS